jgi:hypothetical protein
MEIGREEVDSCSAVAVSERCEPDRGFEVIEDRVLIGRFINAAEVPAQIAQQFARDAYIDDALIVGNNLARRPARHAHGGSLS